MSKASAVPEGFTKFETDDYMYKPDSCADTPLRGILFDCEEMRAGRFGEWSTLVFKTTEPVLAYDRDQEIETRPVGSIVRIKAYGTLNKLVNLAIQPGKVAEVIVMPRAKVKTPNGTDRWTFDVMIGKSIAREPSMVISPKHDTENPNKGMITNGKNDGKQEEIPF